MTGTHTTIHAVANAATVTSSHHPTGGYAQPKSTAASADHAAARRAVMGAARPGNRHFPE